MNSDTLPFTPMDIDLAEATGKAAKAGVLLAEAKELLERYPACQSITPALDALIVGCEAVVGAMDGVE